MPEEKFTLEAYQKRLRERLRKTTAPQLPNRQSLVTDLLQRAKGLKKLPRR